MESLADGTMKERMPIQRPALTLLFSVLRLISSLAIVTAEDANAWKFGHPAALIGSWAIRRSLGEGG